MSGYTLGEYMDAEKPSYELTEEQVEEIRLAFETLKKVCMKHNAPFIAVVGTGADVGKYDTRVSTNLPIDRTPVEMLIMRHMANSGLIQGVELGYDIIQSISDSLLTKH